MPAEAATPIAVVTAASSGIGEATTRALSRHPVLTTIRDLAWIPERSVGMLVEMNWGRY